MKRYCNVAGNAGGDIMAGMPWFRWSTNERHKAAIKFMPPAGRCLYYALNEIAGELGFGGKVHIAPGVPYSDQQLAKEAEIPVEEVRPAIEHLKRVGILKEEPTHLFLTDFAQRVGDNSTERVRAYRERKKAEEQRGRNDDETLQQRFGNADGTPQITDTDNRSMEEEEGRPPPTPPDPANWIKWHEKKTGVLPTQTELHDAATLTAQGVTDELIIAAIEEAKRKKARQPVTYGLSIVANLQNYGVKTVAEWEAHREEKKRGRSVDGHGTGEGQAQGDGSQRGRDSPRGASSNRNAPDSKRPASPGYDALSL